MSTATSHIPERNKYKGVPLVDVSYTKDGEYYWRVSDGVTITTSRGSSSVNLVNSYNNDTVSVVSAHVAYKTGIKLYKNPRSSEQEALYGSVLCTAAYYSAS